MSEQAVPQPEPNEEDVNTTPPNPTANDGKAEWTMPEPVFRKSSGYLPQGYENRFSQDELRSSIEDNDSTAEMPAPDIEAVIEPQPDISEHADGTFAGSHSTAVTAARVRGSGAKTVFVILGLLLAMALLAAVIAAVYLLYLMPGADSTF